MRGARRSQYVDIGKTRDNAGPRFGLNPKEREEARQIVARVKHDAWHALTKN